MENWECVLSYQIFGFLNSVKNVLKSIFERTYFIFWNVYIITLLGKFQTDTEVSRNFGLNIWLLWGRSSFLASTEALILLRSSIKLSCNLIASSWSGRRCFQLLISGGFFIFVFPTRHWVFQGKMVKLNKILKWFIILLIPMSKVWNVCQCRDWVRCVKTRDIMNSLITNLHKDYCLFSNSKSIPIFLNLCSWLKRYAFFPKWLLKVTLQCFWPIFQVDKGDPARLFECQNQKVKKIIGTDLWAQVYLNKRLDV